ncbi:MAG: hypothetical protein HUU02_10685 [Bacteroidetes bacterium]|nr:hypothetical protein [Bacteroidota bacterium]
MHHMFRTALVLTLSLAAFAVAQEKPSFSVWGGFGAGLSSIERQFNHSSLYYYAGLTYHGIFLKAAWDDNHEMAVLMPFHKDPPETAESRSLLLGFNLRLWSPPPSDSASDGRSLVLNAAAGMSRYSGVLRGAELPGVNGRNLFSYEPVSWSGTGVPIEVELEYRTDRTFGITAGYYVYSNVHIPYHAIRVGCRVNLYTAP